MIQKLHGYMVLMNSIKKLSQQEKELFQNYKDFGTLELIFSLFK